MVGTAASAVRASYRTILRNLRDTSSQKSTRVYWTEMARARFRSSPPDAAACLAAADLSRHLSSGYALRSSLYNIENMQFQRGLTPRRRASASPVMALAPHLFAVADHMTRLVSESLHVDLSRIPTEHLAAGGADRIEKMMSAAGRASKHVRGKKPAAAQAMPKEEVAKWEQRKRMQNAYRAGLLAFKAARRGGQPMR